MKRQPAQWNGPPEHKPADWVDLPQPRILPFNGPIEFKPDDWEERQRQHLQQGDQTCTEP